MTVAVCLSRRDSLAKIRAVIPQAEATILVCHLISELLSKDADQYWVDNPQFFDKFPYIDREKFTFIGNADNATRAKLEGVKVIPEIGPDEIKCLCSGEVYSSPDLNLERRLQKAYMDKRQTDREFENKAAELIKKIRSDGCNKDVQLDTRDIRISDEEVSIQPVEDAIKHDIDSKLIEEEEKILGSIVESTSNEHTQTNMDDTKSIECELQSMKDTAALRDELYRNTSLTQSVSNADYEQDSNNSVSDGQELFSSDSEKDSVEQEIKGANLVESTRRNMDEDCCSQVGGVDVFDSGDYEKKTDQDMESSSNTEIHGHDVSEEMQDDGDRVTLGETHEIIDEVNQTDQCELVDSVDCEAISAAQDLVDEQVSYTEVEEDEYISSEMDKVESTDEYKGCILENQIPDSDNEVPVKVGAEIIEDVKDRIYDARVVTEELTDTWVKGVEMQSINSGQNKISIGEVPQQARSNNVNSQPVIVGHKPIKISVSQTHRIVNRQRRYLGNVYVFGSAARCAGASTIAYNLGFRCSNSGLNRVIVLDLDFSKPDLSIRVSRKNSMNLNDCDIAMALSTGFAEYVRDVSLYLPQVVSSSGDLFSLLPSSSGYTIQTKMQLMSSDFRFLIDLLRQQYNSVIIDVGTYSDIQQQTGIYKRLLLDGGYQNILVYNCDTEQTVLESQQICEIMPVAYSMVLSKYRLSVNPIVVARITRSRIIGQLDNSPILGLGGVLPEYSLLQQDNLIEEWNTVCKGLLSLRG